MTMYLVLCQSAGILSLEMGEQRLIDNRYRMQYQAKGKGWKAVGERRARERTHSHTQPRNIALLILIIGIDR